MANIKNPTSLIIKGSSENKLAQRADGSITSVTVEDLAGVTDITDYAFYNCYGLVSVEFPTGLLSIRNNAFGRNRNNGQSIQRVDIPNTTTTVYANAFYEGNAKYVRIPSSVTSIGNNSFRNGLPRTNTVIFKMLLSASVGSNAFTGINGYIYVPYADIDSYKVMTNMTQYATVMRPLVDAVVDLASIDTTAYTEAWVEATDKGYTYNGSQWEENPQ